MSQSRQMFVPMLLVLTLISGCTSYFKRSVTVAQDKKDNFKGAVFVWEADSNAAMVTVDGKTCMQNALAISDSDTQLKVSLNKSADELAKTLAKANENGFSPENQNAIAALSSAITQTAKALNVSTERTSFLNIGMFYLCQLSANGGLTTAQLNTLTETLLKQSASMKATQPLKDDSAHKAIITN